MGSDRHCSGPFTLPDEIGVAEGNASNWFRYLAELKGFPPVSVTTPA